MVRLFAALIKHMAQQSRLLASINKSGLLQRIEKLETTEISFSYKIVDARNWSQIPSRTYV